MIMVHKILLLPYSLCCKILHQRQDARSLALFRILLGLYVIYDIISRIRCGRLDLLWYTSSTENSFLHPDDTPHRSPIHRIWFYRGGPIFQLVFGFGGTLCLAILYTLGYKQRWTKVALWLMVTAMQNRNMHVHDGSDTYVRHLLLWSCQLPMAQTWSLDYYYYSTKYNYNRQDQRRRRMIIGSNSQAAVLGLRLQFVLMYLGTILNRTTDLYGSNYEMMFENCKWLPPQLSAVYYTLHSSFAIRNNWLVHWIQMNYPLSQIMTLMSMIVEFFAPIFLLLCASSSTSSIFPKKMNTILQLGCIVALFSLHFGLLLVMNLPNWQFAALSAIVIWIPSSVWESPSSEREKKLNSYKKTDEITATEPEMNYNDNDDDDDTVIHSNQRRRLRPQYITYVLLFYMLYNFSGERRWIPKHDDGDIGEFLRFSQYWVMFGTPPLTAETAEFIGTILENNDKEKEVDMWEYMKTTTSLPPKTIDNIIPAEMSGYHQSPRIERALSQWINRNDVTRIQYYLSHLCRYYYQKNNTAKKFHKLTIKWKHWRITNHNSPPDERYIPLGKEKVVEVKCFNP